MLPETPTSIKTELSRETQYSIQGSTLEEKKETSLRYFSMP